MYETTTKSARNAVVVNLLVAGKSLREVQEALIALGHDKIDTTRIWRIWKRSPAYVAKRAKLRSCSFCSEQNESKDMMTVSDGVKVVGKLCKTCWDNGQFN